jgi:UDP-glucose 4-epimerase
MKILVTGGAGFIGSHVLERLARDKGNTITVLDNLDSGIAENIPSGVAFIREDIRSSKIINIFQENTFDAVIHLAAQTMVPYSIAHPNEDADINLIGLINVLEAARLNGVKSVVFSSSAAVYGNSINLPLKENETLVPTSFYGITKMTTEHYLRVYHELYGINTTVLRFANVYGERQGIGGEGGVVCIFSQKISENQSIDVFGDGEQTRDFVYVKDIAKAICGAIEHKGFGIYNVSTNTEVSVNELIGAFEKASRKKIQVNYLPARAGDIYRSVLSNKALKTEFKIDAFTSLEEGLNNTYNYFVTSGRK